VGCTPRGGASSVPAVRQGIAEAGVEVTDLAELTGLPAILDHRVVHPATPKVHGGLVGRPAPTSPSTGPTWRPTAIEAIDLVVVNLVPVHQQPQHSS